MQSSHFINYSTIYVSSRDVGKVIKERGVRLQLSVALDGALQGYTNPSLPDLARSQRYAVRKLIVSRGALKRA